MADAIRLAPPSNDHDWKWLSELWEHSWGGPSMIVRGRTHHLRDLQAIVAWDGKTYAGAATFHVEQDRCELISLNALERGQGIGSRLMAAVEAEARQLGCRRIILITTNDNLDSLRFYQRRGFRISAVHRGAVDLARKLKPTIPLKGHYGIPLHDELELERPLL